MKNRLLKMIASLSAVILIAVFAATGVSAEKSKTFTLERDADIEISVVYKDTAPSVKVTGPDKTYSEDGDFDIVSHGDGAENFVIKNAKSGNWSVELSSEGEITVLYYTGNVNVDYFTVEPESDTRANVKMKVDYEKEASYDVSVFAVSDGNNTGLPETRVLRETYGYTNRDESFSLGLSDLPDGKWTFYAEIELKLLDGVSTSLTAYSDTEYTATGRTEKGDESKIVYSVDLTNETLNVDWSGIDDRSNNILVTVVDGNGEMLCYDKYGYGVTSAQIVTDPSSSDTLEVRVIPLDYRENYTTFYRKTVPLTPSESVSVDTPESTSSGMAQISYKFGNEYTPVRIEINGKSSTYQFKGENVMSVRLNENDNNDIRITYRSADGVDYSVSKTVSVHSFPPALNLFGIEDGSVTYSESITVNGLTDGAYVELNGQKIDVSDDGTFKTEVKLEIGENVLEFVSDNGYGAKTVRTLKIIRRSENGETAATKETRSGIERFIPLIAGAGSALLATAALAVTLIFAKKKKAGVGTTILLVLTVLSLFSALILGAGSGYSFYRSAKEKASISGNELVGAVGKGDFKGIYGTISLKNEWSDRGLLLALIGGGCLLLGVLLIVITIIIRRHRKNKKGGGISAPAYNVPAGQFPGQQQKPQYPTQQGQQYPAQQGQQYPNPQPPQGRDPANPRQNS